jgi:hypothetical protein
MKTLWRHRLLTLPVFLIMMVGVVYAVLWGPRSYDSATSYVFISPRPPTAQEIAADPSLAGASAANPYLRATSDPSLAAQVVVSKLSSEVTAKALVDQGIQPEFTALPGGGGGGGSAIVTITSTAGTPALSLRQMSVLGDQLVAILKDAQLANGADPRYLISAIQIDASVNAIEKVSSRLRTVVVVAAGGVVLLFGVLSIAQARENSRRRRSGIAVEPAPPTLAATSASNGLHPSGTATPVSSPPFIRSPAAPDQPDDPGRPTPPRREPGRATAPRARHAAAAVDTSRVLAASQRADGQGDAAAQAPPSTRSSRRGLRRAAGDDLGD